MELVYRYFIIDGERYKTNHSDCYDHIQYVFGHVMFKAIENDGGHFTEF